MSENTLNADAPTPETFDVADWLTGGTTHRPTRSVTVYRDLHLSAELERVRAEIDAYKATTPQGENGPEESLGGDTDTSDLEERAEDLLTRLRAARADLTVRGLIRPELLAIQGKHDESSPAYDYAVLAKAVEFPGGQSLTEEQWARFHETIGQGQFNRIIAAYQTAQNVVPDVSAPFSRRASSTVTGM